MSIGRVEQSWNCSLDEMAIYEEALPPDVVFAHYLDAMTHHRPYGMKTSGLSPAPTPNPVRPADPKNMQASDYDPMDFAPGTELPTPPGNATQGVIITAIEQLRHFPRPRFDTVAVSSASHKMMRNFNWMDVSYMSGQGQPDVPRSTIADTSVEIQSELASSWNYGKEVMIYNIYI
jgi:hypothetical protein